VQIRPAAAADASAVTALWTEAYADAGPEGRREPYAEAEFFAAAAKGEMTVVADAGGTVVAVVVLNPPGAAGRTIGGGGEAELSRLAVAAGARRRGVGRALVERVAERARELGAPAIVLWSRPYQTGAHRLYEALGYRRVPERDGRDDDGAQLVFRMDLG
jgi:ribosomal protein S18 acetylase RimI-like enzyme